MPPKASSRFCLIVVPCGLLFGFSRRIGATIGDVLFFNSGTSISWNSATTL